MSMKAITKSRYTFEVRVNLETKPTPSIPTDGLYYQDQNHEAALDEAGSKYLGAATAAIASARKKKKLSTTGFDVEVRISRESGVLEAIFTSTGIKNQ